MSMTYLFFDVAIWIIGLFFIGYPLTRLSKEIMGAERLPWGLILGISAMIVFIRTVNSFAAISSARALIFIAIAFWLAYHWRRKSTRELLARDVRAINPAMILCWLVTLMLLVVALNVPMLTHHALLYEYSPNHDAIYYVTNARWMLNHRFGDSVIYSADKPLFWMATPFFGASPPLGRVGAEGLLATVSTLTGRDPLIQFQAMQTVALVAGVAVSALVLPRSTTLLIARPTLPGLLIIIALVFAPALIQIPINSSFSNAYGVAIMTAFVAISLRSPAKRVDILQPLLFAGLLATYPELSPIGLAVIASVLLFDLLFHSQSMREVVARGVGVLASVAIAILLFPWISTSAFRVLKTVYFVASTQGASWPNPYAGLNYLQLPIAALTTSRALAEFVPSGLAVTLGAILCVTLFRSMRRSRDVSLTLGVAFALVVFLGYIFYVDFNYGKLKILEYFSLLLAPALITACGFTDQHYGRSRLDMLLSYTAIFMVACMGVGASCLLLRRGIRTANNKYIADDFVDAIRAADNRPDHRFVSVNFESEPFFYSMWVSYFSKEPVLFRDEFGSGGYLQPFTNTHPAAPYEAASATIVDQGAFSQSAFGAKVMGKYGRFLLIDQRGSSRLSSTGLYASEGQWSWMARRLTLNIHGDRAHFVNLILSNRYAPVSKDERISIVSDDLSCDYFASTASNKLSIPIRNVGKNHLITIAPTGRAVSPSMLGQSDDNRILTYQVSELALSANAKFTPVACARSQ